jgi:hypothetical protein
MTSSLFTPPILFAAENTGWLCGGALIGAAYFLTLRWNVDLLAYGRAVLLAALLQAGRFLLLAALLAAIAAGRGVLPLLLTTAGILLARTSITMRSGVAT